MTKTQVPEPGPITLLPLDKHGRRIPWFIQQPPEGPVDFRVSSMAKYARAVCEHLCWLCGHQLRHPDGDAFIIGPMCTINRVSPEPPSHRACARYAAQACPFLATPHMRRRETGLPEDTVWSENGSTRNPGVTAIWCTATASLFTDTSDVPLFSLGEPSRVWWFTEGRVATRDEVLAALDAGMPILDEAARLDGGDAVADNQGRYAEALRFLPTAAA